MTYNINNTVGTQLFQIADGTTNSDLSLTLVGRNYSGWGEVVNENFVKLLENSASSTEPAPAKLLPGQLWYDTGNGQLKIYNGTRFKPLPVTVATSAPAGPATGDMWWHSTDKQLKVYDGSTWLIVGPLATNSGASKTGWFSESILDSLGASHDVSVLYVVGTRVSIVSKDSVFAPAANLASTLIGFSSIAPGVNINTNMASGLARFVGTATNSEKITGYAFPSVSGNNGKYLTTDGTTLSWGTVSGSGGSSTLRSLTDVSLDPTPSSGQVLKYNSSTSSWYNADNSVSLTIYDETTSITSSPVSLKFVGTGVTATNSSGEVTVAIPAYSLPTASTTVLGGVKVDGTSITINGSGVISSSVSASSGVMSFSLYYKITSGVETFTVPAGVTKLRVTIGSGVYYNGTNIIYTTAAGFVTVTPGASITVTVGAAGGNSSFGTYLTAVGPGTSSTPGAAGGSALITTYSIGMVNIISKSADSNLSNGCAGTSTIPAVTAAYLSGTPSTLLGYVIVEY